MALKVILLHCTAKCYIRLSIPPVLPTFFISILRKRIQGGYTRGGISFRGPTFLISILRKRIQDLYVRAY